MRVTGRPVLLVQRWRILSVTKVKLFGRVRDLVARGAAGERRVGREVAAGVD
jgi:hypothetical protein